MKTELIDFLKTNDAKFYAILLAGITIFYGYRGLVVEYEGVKVELGTNNPNQLCI
ncbi:MULTISPECIES: hypothetical protein [Streptococcus]|uniref:hypothetical protein n=1 Tax=Streptococcus TaxID=1301 RepID=UPI0013751992|nr:hypothetical protein [Streptococcus suis]MBM0194642.1 hypothetical protein [Streptococcus suis]MBM7316455.1 hypothetical protein [Streptococcus suis]MBM7320715.1 hypothetical protein [Streptococcus suis]MCK4023838.1 hypothetical protein [Streptococcus suis]HEM4694476.1 hypothetical protein [Streptococcus suis]